MIIFIKLLKKTVDYLVENNIDTLVIGHTKFWKQESDMNKTNNQNFVSIPFNKFIFMLKYLCERVGIKVIEREESYTSKASFLDMDFIPTYGDKNIPTFSGKRIKRGLYKTNNKKYINADVNGSFNILRKEFPNAFTVMLNMHPVVMII